MTASRARRIVEVVPVVLILHDIATRKTGHVQVVAQLLLLQAELLPTGNLVPQYADVGELVRFPLEVSVVAVESVSTTVASFVWPPQATKKGNASKGRR